MHNKNKQRAIGNVDVCLSNRIDSLRFLLIVFVVFIHNHITEVNFADRAEIYEIPLYVEKIRYLFSQIIARVAVPLFFLISGYLLYVKETDYTMIIKKKCRTILLPYILWNVLSVIFYFVAQSFSFTKPYFANILIRNFGIIEWLDVFRCPLVYQFWFLRDLFILFLLCKILKKLVDIFPFATFVALCLLWVNNINIYIVSNEALLFFVLGYYSVKYSLDYKKLDGIKSIDIAVVYLTGITVELFFSEYVPTIHKINIIVGSIVLIKTSYYFIRNAKIKNILIRLEPYAFFVYAIHEPYLTVLKKLSVRIIPMRGGWILLQYFGIAFLGIIIFLGIGVAVKRLFPKLYGILTGGRDIKNKV